MGEKPSPLGDGFGVILCDARVQGVEDSRVTEKKAGHHLTPKADALGGSRLLINRQTSRTTIQRNFQQTSIGETS
jgi:hypothetical protein